MKQLTIILLLLISGTAYGQSSPTSAKTRFVNGLYMGTKLDSYFNTADSNAIYWRADSVVMAKYKGTARALAFAVSGGYIPYSDTGTILSQVVRTFGTQTVGGNKTFINDIVVNGATIGRRTARNIVFGAGALNSSTTGVANTAIGDTALFANTSGNSSTAVGAFSLANNTASSNDAFGAQSLLFNTTGTLNAGLGNRALLYNTTGSRNIGIGSDAGSVAGNNPSASTNTTPSKSIYIGFATRALANNQTNQIVIGDSAIGNGSNTVTIGNSSVTDNYFTGNVRANQFTVGAPTITNRKLAASGGADSVSLLLEEYGSTLGSAPEIFLFKGRGSVASKSNVIVGDDLGSISAAGYVDGSYNLSAIIGTKVTNVNTTNDYADADVYVSQSYNGTTMNENFKIIANGGHGYVRGNLYLGVTSPAAWSGRQAVQIAENSYITSSGANLILGANVAFDGANRIYITSAAATNYRQTGGEHRFETAASGTAGNSISFSRALTLTSANRMLVNTATDNGVDIGQFNGSVSISSLAGTGDRLVQANSSGQLSATQAIASGTYTPTLTNTTNISSSTLSQATYTQVGNIVTVSIGITLTPTLSATNTVLTVTLPVTTATGTQDFVGSGTVFGNLVSNLFASGIVNVTSTTQATFTFYATALTSSSANFQFQYKVN